MCCLSFNDKETLDRLFLFCVLLTKAWNMLFRIFYTEFCLPNKVDSWMLEGLNRRGFSSKGNILWRCASRSLLRFFWKEKKSRIFKDNYNSFDSFWTVFQHPVSWWSTNYTKHFCNYSLSMIFNNWMTLIF